MKVNFHYHCHSWYLVERDREFVMEGMKSLFVSVSEGKCLLPQDR